MSDTANALEQLRSWAKNKGYEPTKRGNAVSWTVSNTLVKATIDGDTIKLDGAGPAKEEAIAEGKEVLATFDGNFFEDEPVNLVEAEPEQPETTPFNAPKETKPAVVKKATPVNKPTSSEAKQTWDEYTGKKLRTYEVSGREELTAFQVSELMNENGLSSELILIERSPTMIKAVVRVTNPVTGHSREDGKVIDRDTFFTNKMIDIAVSQNKTRPGFIEGFDQDGRPRVNPNRPVKGVPAPIWLMQQVVRAWSTADGNAITSAERRAALKMLNTEWRDKTELQTDIDEANGVQDLINAQ